MLAIPVPTTPGCMPRNGVSKAMSPRMRRWKSCWPLELSGGSRTTSAPRIPPRLWPTRMTSVVTDS